MVVVVVVVVDVVVVDVVVVDVVVVVEVVVVVVVVVVEVVVVAGVVVAGADVVELAGAAAAVELLASSHTFCWNSISDDPGQNHALYWFPVTSLHPLTDILKSPAGSVCFFFGESTQRCWIGSF